jgi:nitroreductase
MISLDAFEQLVLSRRATRHFKSDPPPAGLIDRLLDIARWAPSGYNLQPTHFVVVTDPEIRSRLRESAMGQRQVAEAPVCVVFTADRRVVRHHLEQIIGHEVAEGAISHEYAQRLRRTVPPSFTTGPVGVGWLWKALSGPVVRRFRPVPRLPALFMREWLTRQAMLSAMTFMLAASAAGLATIPMEGFDESRVKRVLGIPRWHIVCLIVPVGYAAPHAARKTRLPLQKLVHREGW